MYDLPSVAQGGHLTEHKHDFLSSFYPSTAPMPHVLVIKEPGEALVVAVT